LFSKKQGLLIFYFILLPNFRYTLNFCLVFAKIEVFGFKTLKHQPNFFNACRLPLKQEKDTSRKKELYHYQKKSVNAIFEYFNESPEVLMYCINLPNG